VSVQKEIFDALRSAGIAEGDSILVHSSYKSFQLPPPYGPDDIIKGLLMTVGDRGTVLFPALSYLYVTENNPVFDVVYTRSCIGFLPEYFRVHFAEKRSLCPTHSVSGVGKDVDFFLKDHIKDSTPLGENSPYRKLKEKRGKILFFGCGLKPNTSMHAIEELVEPEYLFDGVLRCKLITEDDRVIAKTMKKHGFHGYAQRYDRVVEVMPQDSIVKTRVLASETYIIDAATLWEKAHEKLKENPLYFVDRIGER